MYDTSPPQPKITIFSCVKLLKEQSKRSSLFGEKGVRDCFNIVLVNDLWGINVKSRCISSHTLLSSSFSNTALHHSNHQLYVCIINIFFCFKRYSKELKILGCFLFHQITQENCHEFIDKKTKQCKTIKI